MVQVTPTAILGEITDSLVSRQLVTKDQLAVAQVTKKNLGGDIGHILIKKGFVEEERIRQLVSEQLQIETVKLSEMVIEPAVVKAIPLSIAQRFRFMPLFRLEDTVTIAISDPLDLFGILEAQGVTSFNLRAVLASTQEIEDAHRLHYQAGESAAVCDDSIQLIQGPGSESDDADEKLEEMASGVRVITAVNTIIARAIQERASDIHIEPQEENTKIRYRLDGVLEERMVFPRSLHLPIVSRLKVMANVDIAERRVPQDGRIRLKIKGQLVDLRLSTYPTMNGEKIVMRVLVKEKVLSLEQLGLLPDAKKRFSELIERPHGIFLVTGPTGSGKTSTLYAALSRVNSQERNIVSVEDPVENEIAGVAQAQVNIKAGMSFAVALRAILRQDPDIIMVGEVRDQETADMAVRAALTGHLVFSTLHTNTAIGAVERLSDMGVERFLISSSLLGIMAQRLVRRICKSCCEEIIVSDEEKSKLKEIGYEGPLFRGRGCRKCRMGGYNGRIGIYELVVMDEELRRLIAKGSSEDQLKEYLVKIGVRDIRADGFAKVSQGVTTIDEVLRVTQED